MAFTWVEATKELEERRARALELGGPARIERQHKRGKKTARERIDMLVDPGEFQEIGILATYNRPRADGAGMETTPSGYISGLAKIDGRNVALGVHDYTVSGGTTTTYLSRVKGEVGGFTDELAFEYKIPVISLVDGAGAGDEPNVTGSGSVFVANGNYNVGLRLMDEVPVLGALLGPAAGLAAGRAVLGHFTVMTRDTACLFMGGPPVVKVAMGIDIDKFELGGAQIHTSVGGIDNVADDEEDAIRQIKAVLSFLPQNVWSPPPVIPCDDPITRRNDALTSIVPENRRRAFDVKKVIAEVFDPNSFFEIGPNWGKSIVQGFARIGGYPVGVIAGNAHHLGGAMDAQSCDKQVRFMSFCDTFHLPIVTLIDNGGFMLGQEAEKSGINRSALRSMMAAQMIDVPIISIVMRKAYGLGVLSQWNTEKLGLRLAWPSAETGAMPAEGEVDALFQREIQAADDPAEYRRMAIDRLHALKSPWKKAESFEMADVIHPAETRWYVGRFIEASWSRITARLGPPKRWPIV